MKPKVYSQYFSNGDPRKEIYRILRRPDRYSSSKECRISYREVSVVRSRNVHEIMEGENIPCRVRKVGVTSNLPFLYVRFDSYCCTKS